jgi:hypothetical protein
MLEAEGSLPRNSWVEARDICLVVWLLGPGHHGSCFYPFCGARGRAIVSGGTDVVGSHIVLFWLLDT